MKMTFRAALFALTLMALTTVSSFASTIALAMSGDARVGTDYIEFGKYPQGTPFSPAPGFGVFEVTSPVTSLFAANGVSSGEFGTIQSFNSTLEQTGNKLATPVEFMTFETGGSNLQLYLTELYQGNLPSPPPSPFILSDTPSGATAAFDITGYVLNTNDSSQTPFIGVFSTTFSGLTVAELLGSLPVETTFSATLSLTPVPEPTSLLMIGVGLLGAGILGRKRMGCR